jgi:hypothetical protein
VTENVNESDLYQKRKRERGLDMRVFVTGRPTRKSCRTSKELESEEYVWLEVTRMRSQNVTTKCELLSGAKITLRVRPRSGKERLFFVCTAKKQKEEAKRAPNELLFETHPMFA